MANNIVLTGGHAGTTALAVIEKLQKKGVGSIYWIGSKTAFEGKSVKTLESEVLPKKGIAVIEITTGRIQRKFTRFSLLSIIKIPIGFMQAFWHLVRIRPRVILSFGGYASFPVVLIGKMLGAKIIIHDQTAAAGRANRMTSFLADKILLSRRGSLEFFPSNKSKITGNPVMEGILKVKFKRRPSSLKTIYITGGSRGSQAINRVAYKILPELLKNHKVIHQTGSIDFNKFEKFRNNPNYLFFDRIDPGRLTDIYNESDIVVARAGANTVSEIMAIKRPAIFVPLPISYLDEQTKNAQVAQEFGIARIIPQKTLTPKKLIGEIEKAFTDYEKITSQAVNKKSPDINSAEKVARELL